jgi:ribosomal protein L12E/L44/L45/RPP1/RPP2
MPPRSSNGDVTRKLIAFDQETWHALNMLTRDSLKTIQELAEEAFADLLRKHHRPVTLKDALRQSARMQPANDPAPAAPKAAAKAEAKQPGKRTARRKSPRRR